MKKCIEWGKKFLQVAFCASLIFALTGLTACSDDDSSSGGGVYVDPDQEEVPTPAPAPEEATLNTKTIKNRVQNYTSDGKTYYEYLTFTDDEGGTYALYEEGADGTLTAKTTSLTIDSVTYTIPTDFGYNKATYTLSAPKTTPTKTTYLFKTLSTYIVALEKGTTTASPKDFYSPWKTSSNEVYQFETKLNKDPCFLLKATLGSSTNTTQAVFSGYAKDSAVSALYSGEGPGMYYITSGVEGQMYLFAQKAIGEVEAAGRALLGGKKLASSEVCFESKGFWLLSK